MHNFRCDPDLGVGNASVRRILNAGILCIEQFELPWDDNEENYNQKRYIVNKIVLHWNVVDGLKDWNTITLVATSRNIIEKDGEIFETIFKGVQTGMSEKILSTMYNAMKIDDKNTITLFSGKVYCILPEDKNVKEYTQLIIAYVYEIVCATVF